MCHTMLIIGMDEEIIKHAFEPFFTTSDLDENMGLGLSTAKEIIDEHRGNIKLVSELGKGTTFTITLPKIHQ